MIDGKNFKSRNQLINIIWADWLAKEKHPEVPQTNPYRSSGMGGGRPAPFTGVVKDDLTVLSRSEVRNEYRRQLLGDDWDKYQHSNSLVFEEDETGEVNRQKVGTKHYSFPNCTCINGTLHPRVPYDVLLK